MRERVTFKKRNAVELPFEYMATFDKVHDTIFYPRLETFFPC